jgi:DNA replication and repair protein RecF
MNPLLQTHYQAISDNQDGLAMDLIQLEPGLASEEAVLDILIQYKSRELAAQRSLVGPHRDDWQFFLNDQPISASASRGETRSVLLAILAAQKQLLQSVTEKIPILLLDDVFSELDGSRQKHLEKLAEGTQVFYTTTHEEHFSDFLGPVQSFEIL